MKTMNTTTRHDRGFSADAGGTMLLILVFTGFVIAGVWALWGQKDEGVEQTNLQRLATNTMGMMRDVDGYSFTSGAKMTGALIQKGAAKGITIKGEPSSGTATLTNVWGGAIVVAPDAGGGTGFNNGFTITTEKVPQSACIALTVAMSRGGGPTAIKINGTSHADGKVTGENASSECTADNGRLGVNTLVFSYNG